MLGIEPTVTLVNRLIGDDGKPIPYDFTFDGIPGTVVEKLQVPVGPARIIVHNSMYRYGANGIEYRLGVPEWDLPCTPLPPSEFRDELIDRAGLGYPRQTIKGAVLKKGPPLKAAVQRRDPISVNNPGGRDGAFPGFYGESQK